MATETGQQETAEDEVEIVLDRSEGYVEVGRDRSDDGVEIVLERAGDDVEVGRDRSDDGVEIVLERAGDDVEVGRDRSDDGGSVIVDFVAVDEAVLEAASVPTVEVTVVDDAYITADHADAPQVFASAARLRPLFAALSVVLMISVALALYGISVLLAA